MDELTVKTAAVSSILFLIFLVAVFEISSGYSSEIHAKEPVAAENTLVHDKNEEPTIEMNPDDNLVVPLPDTVTKDKVSVSVDMISKKVIISFSVSTSTFDVANVVNTAVQINQITYQSDKDMISINIQLKDYYETVWSFVDGKLYMRFLPIDRSRPLVVVDPGHGGTDVGADKGGIYEKNITMSICRKLKSFCANEPFKLYFTREGDFYPTVEERAEFANILQPDLFVSVHANWYDDPSINGTGVLYNTLNGTDINSSYWLASILNEETIKAMGTANMGLIDGNSIYVVRYTKVTAALVELGFMTNESDLNIMTSEEGQNNAARGLCNGIKRALKENGKMN